MPSTSTPSFGQLLQSTSAELARDWRHRAQEGLSGAAWILQLDGAAERFIFELGRAMDSVRPGPGSAWSRTAGIVRLAPPGDTELLEMEFGHLRELLVELALHSGHPAEAERVRNMVEVAKALCLMEQQAPGGEAQPAASRFGGVVVRTFGAPCRARHRVSRAA